ncbi:B12-binding domain-containing radical SAM protein [Actinokineospora sp.]|uniref:B12-binding domain-containing radical SAM protein n=1 Tax=Actinokineospora sp. TaxID=1872133 RepID=UPI003D6A47C3
MIVTVKESLGPFRTARTDHADRLEQLVTARRHRFGASAGQAGSNTDEVFRFPVMAALAPVATSRGGEVAYPGDPMCLYAALAVTIQRSARRRESGLPAAASIDDVYPDWGVYPDLGYRQASSGPREGLIVDNATTDGKVFDPRIWDARAKARYIAELRALRPRVVLLSAVSAAHRYALEMAELAKAHVPGCVVVLGGRHADETVRFERKSGLLRLSWSSTTEVIRDGRSKPVVDFVVSGDGAPCLDLLMRGISLVTDPGFADFDVDAALEAVRLIAMTDEDLSGIGTIVGFGREAVLVQPVEGRGLSRSELPAPYEAFAIRARFGVFQRAGSSPHGSRTAHMMTLDACPFKCTFCSESIEMKGRSTRFAVSETQLVARHVKRLVDHGAEAVFFDDPVLWGGNWTAISAFCHDLLELSAEHDPMRRLEWGAQLTVDVVLNRAKAAEIGVALDLMRQAGCSYIYIGIESMAEPVMKHVNKNLLRRNPEPWVAKVHEALRIIKSHRIRVGSSVLFGLEGENQDTIAETIEQIGRLIDDDLLVMASPNILTYHPGTPVTESHGREKLDYHSRKDNRPPYTYFEEAYPEVVSTLLSEKDIWYIHRAAARRWGNVRNSAADILAEEDMSIR